jgi:hypothetical protein
MKIIKRSGAVLLITLVLILISAAFVLLIYQQKQQVSIQTATTFMDMSIAEHIAKLGVDIGLNEWKNDENAKNKFSSSQPTPLLTGYSILGGNLDLYSSINGNLITLTSIGKYNGLTKTIELHLLFTSQKKLVLLVGTGHDTDTSTSDRKTFFESYGWEVTVVSGNPPNLYIILENVNLIYIASSAETSAIQNVTDLPIPIAMEFSSNSNTLGLSLTSPTLITSITNLTRGSNCHFNYLDDGNNFFNTQTSVYGYTGSIALGAYIEYTVNSYPVLVFLEPNKIRANGTINPHVRLALPFRISSSPYDWRRFTSTALHGIAQYLDAAGCNYPPPSCYNSLIVDAWAQLN